MEPGYFMSFLKINNKIDKPGGEYKLLYSLEHTQILNFSGDFSWVSKNIHGPLFSEPI